MKVHQLIDKPEKWLKNCLSSSLPALPNQEQNLENKLPYNASYNAPLVSFCIVGAACYLYGGVAESFKKQQEIAAKLGFIDKETGKGSPVKLVKWNNNPELTFEEFHRTLVEKDI